MKILLPASSGTVSDGSCMPERSPPQADGTELAAKPARFRAALKSRPASKPQSALVKPIATWSQLMLFFVIIPLGLLVALVEGTFALVGPRWRLLVGAASFSFWVPKWTPSGAQIAARKRICTASMGQMHNRD